DNHEEQIGDPHTTHQHNSRVDLSAPGYLVNISDSPVNYTVASGSSYAAPLVTGTVALMLSVNPCLDNDEIEQILKGSSVNIDAINPAYAGSIGVGRLNAKAAVSMALATQGNMDVVALVTNACVEGQGSITISPSQGQEPYQVSTSNGQSEFYFGNLNSGTYTYQVTDAHGCVMTTSAVVTNGAPTIQQAVISNASCNGGTDGSIELTVDGGNPSYTFNWSNGVNTVNNSTLTAGTYYVQITDANGCTTSGAYDLTEPTALDLNPLTTSDFGNNDGSIDLNVTGGTPGYTYTWSNGETTEDLDNLSAGIYTVMVTDNNGCQTSTNVEITNESSANTNALVDVYLNVYPNPSHGDVKISWKGLGAELLVVTQTGSQVLRKKVYNIQTTEVFNLAPGVYTLKLIGVNGGTATKQLVIL
ncbi:MAG: T9SS type A sorting domain-containing protein, partial [Flavobacteriales bacterium]